MTTSEEIRQSVSSLYSKLKDRFESQLIDLDFKDEKLRNFLCCLLLLLYDTVPSTTLLRLFAYFKKELETWFEGKIVGLWLLIGDNIFYSICAVNADTQIRSLVFYNAATDQFVELDKDYNFVIATTVDLVNLFLRETRKGGEQKE